MSIILQGRLHRRITQAQIHVVRTAASKEQALWLCATDRLLDWCCGSRKAAALGHLYNLTRQSDPDADFSALLALVAVSEHPRFQKNLVETQGKYFITYQIAGADGLPPLLNTQVEIPQEAAAQCVVSRHGSFFDALIGDQARMQAFFESRRQTSEIADYTNAFTSVVVNAEIAVKKRWKSQVTPDCQLPSYLWRRGEYGVVLRKWPEIRRFILSNKEHPAILQWEAAHHPS